MKHYMAKWRENRRLMNDPCECGNRPRLGYEKGCARCEALDQQRYARRCTSDVVGEALARYDAVSVAELADALGLRKQQTWRALRTLTRQGRAELCGPLEYRTRRAA